MAHGQESKQDKYSILVGSRYLPRHQEINRAKKDLKNVTAYSTFSNKRFFKICGLLDTPMDW
jgi:peroxiredoxin